MAKMINDKNEKMLFLGQSDGSYCVSITDKNDKVIFVAAPRMNATEFNKLLNNGSNWKFIPGHEKTERSDY